MGQLAQCEGVLVAKVYDEEGEAKSNNQHKKPFGMIFFANLGIMNW